MYIQNYNSDFRIGFCIDILLLRSSPRSDGRSPKPASYMVLHMVLQSMYINTRYKDQAKDNKEQINDIMAMRGGSPLWTYL